MIVGVKGLRAPIGKNNITKYVNKLNSIGVEAEEFKYASFLVAHTYILEKIFKTEKKLYDLLKEGDSIIAHSFGGVLVTDLLTNMSQVDSKKKLKNIYLFNPSVDHDIRIPETHFENLIIFYEPDDKMLTLAKYLPFNKLGTLGKYGYRYPSNKIHNVRIDKGPSSWSKHDGAMHEPNLTKYAECIKIIETANESEKIHLLREMRN